MKKSKVVIRSTESHDVKEVIREIFDLFEVRSIVKPETKVAIKVNLSTPDKALILASNTSIEILDAVCDQLTRMTQNVVVGESDGMRYKSEEAFENSEFYPVLEKYGVKAMNFSKDEWVETGYPLIKGWGLPKTLLDADVFMTLPVLKTHATTVFTGALKNQFGCYPQYNRILLHPHLDKVLVLINKILKPQLAIMDGIVAMEGRGPINGNPRKMGLILASKDPVALDSTGMRLIGLDPCTSGHIALAAKEGLGQIHEELIEVDGDFKRFQTRFEPAERDFPIRLLAFLSHSKFLTNRLILNPEAFYPLKQLALKFRDYRDSLMPGGK